jgi:predicted DNA-binding transcriptional regulator AlpA
MSKWLSLQDVAVELQIPLRTIQYYRTRDESFPAVYQFGKRHSRITREDFDAWKEAKLS